MRANTLILIPARSGSTRVKGKNIRVLGEKPLIGHVITAARESGAGRVVVSTNDEEIAGIAKKYGAAIPFLRPAELSDAHASSVWCILHALQWFKDNENWIPEIVAFCPPTNPFLKKETITIMSQTLLERKDVNSIVTIAEAATHPFTIVGVADDGRLRIGVIPIGGKTIRDIERSQDWPSAWQGSAACRMTRSAFFFSLLNGKKSVRDVNYGKTYDADNCMGYKIDKLENCDIDDESDWLMAEQLIKAARSGPA